MCADRTVLLHYCHGKIYVWNAEDAMLLRQVHHICGSLVGCLQRSPWQNNQLSLPLQLLPEEARLLIEKGIAELVDEVEGDVQTDDEHKRKELAATYRAMTNERNALLVQLKADMQQKAAQRYASLKCGSEGRLRRREPGTIVPSSERPLSGESETPVNRGAGQRSDGSLLSVPDAEACTAIGSPADGTLMEDATAARGSESGVTGRMFLGESATEAKVTDKRSADLLHGTQLPSGVPLYVQLFTESPWQRQVKIVNHLVLSDGADDGQVTRRSLCYRVFSDLWHQGYYVTGGCNFGGDYLVYPGDPARFHSRFIAICNLPAAVLTAEELSMLARLATSVNKTLLLCTLDEGNRIVYTTLSYHSAAS